MKEDARLMFGLVHGGINADQPGHRSLSKDQPCGPEGHIGGVSALTSAAPDPGVVEDDDLMKRYRGGDANGFDLLYARYERRIYSFCLRMLGDQDSAADAFQDTFIRVVAARADYQPRGRFGSWLYTIARRVCLDRLRAVARTEPLDHHAAVLIGGDADPGDRAATNDTIDRLLARLPLEQREVVVLNRYHGFTYREIAELLESTEAAVKQKAYRAVETLRGVREGTLT